MKVQNNTSIFLGNPFAASREQENGQNGKKSVFAGNLGQVLDPVEKKRQEARKQAMKIIGDAWDADRQIDDDIRQRRDKIVGYKEQLGQAGKELKWFADERAKLQQSYGAADESQEQQDLKLLEKQVDAGRGQASLSKEDRERLARIEAAGLTEYQERSMAFYEESRYYEDLRMEAQDGIKQESAAIEAIQLARLKSQGMAKASKNAEGVMEAASEKIIGMLTEEAKEHVDKELEEKTEAAKEAEEKKEAEEETLKKAREKKEDREEFTEQVLEAVEYMIDLENSMEDVQKEIKKIVEEMKLTEEDIKGAAVDMQS